MAEKALKAFLYAQGEVIVLGHAVSMLAEKAAAYEQCIAQKKSIWNILDGYYILTRYPNGLPDSIPARVYNQQAARSAVDIARDVVETVGKKIGC